MKHYKSIAKSIKSMVADINAEVILADLIELGFEFKDILVRHDGLFKRNYSKDILNAYYDVISDIFTLNVSRDSLYDILPHGMFHHMFRDFKSENREGSFEKLKKEEESARKFFVPFDNEFFIQYIELELELRKYFKSPGKFLQNLLFFYESVPYAYAVKLSTYVLFADNIIGNPKLTALLLSDIIEEDVEVSAFYSSDDLLIEETRTVAGNFTMGESLGINYICGETVAEGRNIWEFAITLGDEKNISKYINKDKGSTLKFLDLFFELFVPFEIEVKTKIQSARLSPLVTGLTAKMEAELQGQNKSYNYLGYNTII